MRTVAPIVLALTLAAVRASAQDSAFTGPGYLIVPTDQERGSARDVSELLAGRAAGLFVRRSGGEVGAASTLYLRGPSHLALPDRPLVVVDGHRAAGAAAAPGMIDGLAVTSPLDELDPEEIDSIRVLPGPAAAARYGPAAAAGALVVTTRRGRGTGFHATGFTRVGTSRDAGDYPDNYARPGTGAGGVRGYCPLAAEAVGNCRPIGDSMYVFNPLRQESTFRRAALWTAGARVDGGAGPASYLAYAAHGTEHGLLRDNGATRSDLHGSVSVRLPRRVEVGMTMAWIDRALTDLPPRNSLLATLPAGLLGSARDDSLHGYVRPVAPFGTPGSQDAFGTRRAHGAAWAAWAPAPWARVEARYGLDRAEREGVERFSGSAGNGQPSVDSTSSRQDLRDASLSAWARLRPLPSLEWRTGAGVERTAENLSRRDIFRSANGSFAEEGAWLHRGVFGAWLSQGLDWRGTVQVDALARRDDPRLQPGPLWSTSASAGWTVSGEPFFPRARWLDVLRLRAAWGRIDALPYLEPDQGFSSLPFFACPVSGPCDDDDNVLRPERSSEAEAGVEARLWGRLALGVTGYRRETSRLVGEVRLPPVGTVAARNLGTVRNSGVEGTIRLDGIATGPARWELELLGATNRNRVTQMDGVLATGVQRVVEGYPLGGYWAVPVASFTDIDGDGLLRAVCTAAGVCEVVPDTLSFLGASQPGHMLAAAARVHLGGALTVAARLEHQGGYRLEDLGGALRCGTFVVCREANDPSTPLAEQAQVVAVLLGSPAGFIEDASFTRLREVSVTLAAPAGWTRRLGAALDLSLSGRNLATWTPFRGLDPEANTAGPQGFSGPSVYSVFALGDLPLPRTWTARLDVRF